jgi:3-phosphoshikimate 1-carboxyvinyltransferase
VSVSLSHPVQASPLRAIRGRALKGRFRPPGDKSISHRAFIFGLLTCGDTLVEGLLEGDDVLRTGEACKALGPAIKRLGPGRWRSGALGSARSSRRARRSTSATPAPARA